MFPQQFPRTQPQQYGYTTYYPTQGIDISSLMNLMIVMVIMVMMMGMMKPMMESARS